MTLKKRVLFLCSYNACRSQMAEGWMLYLKGDEYEVHSAGTHEGELNLNAIKVMAEAGVDISHQKSKEVSPFIMQEFDIVATLCDRAKGACPYFAGAKEYIHKDFADPYKVEGTEIEKLEAFRKTRDEIRMWIEEVF